MRYIELLISKYILWNIVFATKLFSLWKKIFRSSYEIRTERYKFLKRMSHHKKHCRLKLFSKIICADNFFRIIILEGCVYGIFFQTCESLLIRRSDKKIQGAFDPNRKNMIVLRRLRHWSLSAFFTRSREKYSSSKTPHKYEKLKNSETLNSKFWSKNISHLFI